MCVPKRTALWRYFYFAVLILALSSLAALGDLDGNHAASLSADE